MTNILVTGSNGQLGSEIRELSNNYDFTFFFTDRTSLDITNEKDVEIFVQINNINTIINCAAYTAVDKAEANKEKANQTNHLAAGNLAEISKNNGVSLIHLSTDYVYNGKSNTPYIESSTTTPSCVYGLTKMLGDNIIKNINPFNSIIIRTSWMYSSYGENFVKTMLRLGNQRDSLGVIFDQVGTPTYARDLAKVILEIVSKIKNDKVEIYNYSNEGVLSWYDFAKEIMSRANIECIVNPIETKEYPTPATRPHYSLLNKSKIKEEFDIIVPYWSDSLNECLKEINA